MTTPTPEFAYIAGLTGGIASGKSTASKVFASLGAHIVDVDVISRNLTAEEGPAVETIARAFPGVVSHGVIDREWLRSLAFARPANRLRLESILHPLIRRITLQEIAAASLCRVDYILLVVPLLYELDFYMRMIECSIAIDVDRQHQLSRIAQSRNLDSGTAKSIINTQISREARMRRAQFIIDNRGDSANLARQVHSVHELLVATGRHARASAASVAH
jgi:dephospho-CoA kinase